MKELKIEIPSSIKGSVWDSYRTSGLAYGLNCQPNPEGGLWLWRPQLHPTLNAQMFNPANGDVYFDSVCAQNRINILYKDATSGAVKISWWDGTNSGVVAHNYPSVQIGQITKYVNGMALGLRGKGIFFLEWDNATNDWGKTYRLGSLGFSEGNGSQNVGVNTSTTADICSINWSDPDLTGFNSFVSRIVLWVALPQSNLPDFSWTLEIVDGNNIVNRADEVYTRDSVVPPLPNVAVRFIPLTFTFLKDFQLPITIRIVSLSGTTELVLEGASVVRNGVGSQINWLTASSVPVHMSVGGTLCPDGEVVGAFRGSLFGLYKDGFVQVAPAGDFEFQEEFNLEARPIRIFSYLEGVYILGDSKIWQVLGWTARGVEVREVANYGIPDQFSAQVSAYGVWFFIDGRLYWIRGSGLEIIPSPVGGVEQAKVFVSAFDIQNFILISVQDREVVLVFDPDTGGWVFWRFDEIGATPNPYPLDTCKGSVIFSDGIVRYYTRQQFSPSYEVSAVFVSDKMPELSDFQVQALELGGQFYSEPNVDYLRVFIAGYGEDRISGVSQTLTGKSKTTSFDTETFAESSGAGLEFLVPENAEGVLVMNYDFPVLFPSLITTENKSGSVQENTFLVGKKFLVAVSIPASIKKHPANSWTSLSAYGQVIGGGLLNA